MARIAKVTISLPQELLAYIDRRQVESGVSRSEFVRRAIEGVRRDERERELDEQYVRGWREQPETEEEFGWLDPAAIESLADLPWERGEDRDAPRRDLVGEPPTPVGQAPGAARRAG